jgi:rhamnogalacturonyl hydrolase YesR
MSYWKSEGKLIGYVATGLLVLATSLWMIWGVRGLYYEAWWDAWYLRILYLVPGAVCLGLALLALSRPRITGWLLIAIGGAFTAWWWYYVSVTVGLNSQRLLVMFPISCMLVVAGILLVVFERRRAQVPSEEPSPKNWFYRNRGYLLAVGLPLLLAVLISILMPLAVINKTIDTSTEPEGYSESDQFRDWAVQFVRTVAEDYFDQRQTERPEELSIVGNWDLEVAIYHQGEIIGNGDYRAEHESLSLSLEEATRNALDGRQPDFGEEELEDARFLVSLWYGPSFFVQVDELLSVLPYYDYVYGRSFPKYDQSFSFIEYNGEGKELIADLVINRSLDRALILQNIEQGKEFLLRAQHEDEHGFYKKYDAPNDDFGGRLHTVYSASIIYTLLKLYDFDEDERVLESLPDWGEFLLSMQSKDAETYGAFHYSYYYTIERKEQRFVVGTTALSIFTLLDLYERTDDSGYLQSAKLGGDWLTTMQKPDGVMKAYQIYEGGESRYGQKESLLYNGQVLAALSRLYRATGEERYYETAERIAEHFVERVEKDGCYLGDEYRWQNPISSAWIVMSLLDFYQVNQDDCYKDIILKCGSDLLKRQEVHISNPVYYGSWHGAYSTSGNGWLAEVAMEMYRFCQEQNMEGCEEYKEALLRAILWIIQNTYSEENTFLLREPERAIGGIFWSYEDRYVRTDSLCHGLNAYIGIIDELEDGSLLSIPEEPFSVILDKLRN